MSELNFSQNDGSESVLDRVWAATKPRDLSDDAFDQIWANVQGAVDSPAPPVLPMRFAKLAVFIPAGLAAAAAIFVAAFLATRPVDNQNPMLAQNTPVATITEPIISSPFDLEPYETLVIEIDGNTVQDRRLEPMIKGTLALADIPTHNATDVLSVMESQAQ